MDLKELSPYTVLELWSQTYNTDGKPDWSHIFPYCKDTIIFQDSIQRIEGIEDFTAMCNRLTDRCKQLHLDILTIAQTDNVIIFDWIMTMMFKKFLSTSLYGSARLTLGCDGLIAEQQDYYDLWGDIFNNIPRFGKIYRKFFEKEIRIEENTWLISCLLN